MQQHGAQIVKLCTIETLSKQMLITCWGFLKGHENTTHTLRWLSVSLKQQYLLFLSKVKGVSIFMA
jgi:hypothetical protein